MMNDFNITLTPIIIAALTQSKLQNYSSASASLIIMCVVYNIEKSIKDIIVFGGAYFESKKKNSVLKILVDRLGGIISRAALTHVMLAIVLILIMQLLIALTDCIINNAIGKSGRKIKVNRCA